MLSHLARVTSAVGAGSFLTSEIRYSMCIDQGVNSSTATLFFYFQLRRLILPSITRVKMVLIAAKSPSSDI
jgi:hypothetical protein